MYKGFIQGLFYQVNYFSRVEDKYARFQISVSDPDPFHFGQPDYGEQKSG